MKSPHPPAPSVMKFSRVSARDVISSIAGRERNTMAARTQNFICQNCGAAYARWSGKCDACGEWNTLVEEGAEAPRAGPKRAAKGRIFTVEALHGGSQDAPRLPSGIS